MNLYKLSSDVDINKQLSTLNVDRRAIKIMTNKSKIHIFKITDLHVGAANILKQDALSIGAELAVPNGTITCDFKKVDAILIATSKQLNILIQKESIQPYGLKDLSKILKQHIQKFTNSNKPKIMGIINANDDSFYENSRFNNSTALHKIQEMIDDGADIIDIGGVSSRPNAAIVNEDEEFNRVKPLIDELYKNNFFDNNIFSIDSYTPKVVDYALNKGFSILNDITALANDTVANIASKYSATVVLMHMQGVPSTMQNNPSYNHIIQDIDSFFLQRITKAKEFGIENIILDIGIGFGKTLNHNLQLIKHLEHFKYHNYELLVGASRKSMIDMILPTPIKDRLPATLALHQESINNGASILRVHDVKEHFQMISILNELKSI